MKNIVDKCDAIIVGRGGFYVLKNRPNVLRVFIHAPVLDKMIKEIKV